MYNQWNKLLHYKEGNYPCKVLAIVPKEKNDFLEETEIVVWCAEKRTDKDSVLFTKWQLMDGYFRVGIESIVSSVFVLDLGRGKIAACLPYPKWASEFTDTSYNDMDLFSN